MSAPLIAQLGDCPGLAIGDDGLMWIDSMGRAHALAPAIRLSVGEVAQRLKRSEETVRRRIAAGQLYPVVRHSAREIEIYEIAIADYLARATMRPRKV